MSILDTIIVFAAVLSVISSIYSALITKGFLSIMRHKMGREVSLTWGTNFVSRTKELKYISLGSIIFAITFLVDIFNILGNQNALAIPLSLGTISYTIIGYAVYRWAKAIEHI
ncbi:MAG: hypothetical protein QXP36_08840 [Conexivisphaerales archaeon]